MSAGIVDAFSDMVDISARLGRGDMVSVDESIVAVEVCSGHIGASMTIVDVSTALVDASR